MYMINQYTSHFI